MSERKAVTKKLALEYRRAGKARKGQILDELCRLTDWHRNHARKALKQALLLKAVRPRPPRPPLYGPAVVKALRFLWAVQGTPCGRLLAAALPDLVPRLRRLGELSIDDDTAGLLLRIAPATIDRRLAGDRAGLIVRGRSHTKPGTLLKSSIPMRTWAEWDDAVPGFVEIDLVGHEGGNAVGEQAYRANHHHPCEHPLVRKEAFYAGIFGESTRGLDAAFGERIRSMEDRGFS